MLQHKARLLRRFDAFVITGSYFEGMKTKTRSRRPRSTRPQSRPGLESKLSPRPRYEAARYKPAGKLEGKTALVTGGDSGIGRAVAVLFAREGADVCLVFLPAEESDALETAGVVAALGRRCLLMAGDVKDPNFCRKAVQKTVRELGGLHVLVNNAAFQKSADRPEEITPEQWELTFKTNIHAYFFMVHAALEHLQRGSSIINCGSVAGLRGSSHLLDYSAAKGAIETFTKSLSQQLGERGIRVNCVAPGPVWTPLNAVDKSPKELSEFGKKTPMGRPAEPDEIAPAFVFLASEADSGYVSGITLPVAGGEIVS